MSEYLWKDIHSFQWDQVEVYWYLEFKNRTRDLSAHSAVPQRAAPPRTPLGNYMKPGKWSVQKGLWRTETYNITTRKKRESKMPIRHLYTWWGLKRMFWQPFENSGNARKLPDAICISVYAVIGFELFWLKKKEQVSEREMSFIGTVESTRNGSTVRPTPLMAKLFVTVSLVTSVLVSQKRCNCCLAFIWN